jgi:hypothetical protein
VRLNAPPGPSTDSITFFNLEIDRLTLLICCDSQREIPCCLQMRFIVVGHTVKKVDKVSLRVDLTVVCKCDVKGNSHEVDQAWVCGK